MIAALTLSACSIAPMFSFAAITSADNLNDTGAAAWASYQEVNADADFDTWLATLDDDTKATYEKTQESGTGNTGTSTLTSELTLDIPSVPADASISNVRAYQVFTLDVTKEDDKTSYTASAWGSDVNPSGLLTAIQANNIFKDDEGNNVFAGITIKATDDKSYADVASALGKLTTQEQAEAFAKAVMNNLAKQTGTDKDVTGTSATYDKETKKATFTPGLANGYYAFACDLEGKSTNTEVADGEVGTVIVNDNKSVSLAMLTVVDGEAEVIGKDGVAKVGLPEVMKKVLEDDATITSYDASTTNALEKQVNADNTAFTTGGGYNDGADWAIGQKKSFKLYGTLPDNYDEYDTYYYEFCDSLAPQFNRPADNSFVVEVTNGTNVTTLTAGTDYTLTNNAIDDDGNLLISVKFTNLKAISKENDKDGNAIPLIDKDSIITVKYDTALNDSAVIGADGQENEVYLKYSNNPNKSGSGDNETGETPEDRVIVFTYALEFDKQFFEGGSNLTTQEILNGDYNGLVFNLKDGTTANSGKKIKVVSAPESDKDFDYYIVDQDSTAEGVTTDLKLTLIDASGNKINEETRASWTKENAEGARLVIRIKGLDSDEYAIDESKGTWENCSYKEVKDNEVTITSGVKFRQDWDGTTKMTADSADGTPVDKSKDIYQKITYTFETDEEKSDISTASGIIKNTKSSSLPSTGGMGTTLFYLGGGAMVAVAGVFLITKKRMGKSEN